MVLGSSTTWTLGTVLARLEVGEAEVEIYAGPHRHRGLFQGAGDHILMLQDHGDVIALQLSSLTGIRVLGGLQGISDRTDEVEDVTDVEGEFVPPSQRVEADPDRAQAQHEWVRENLISAV